MSASAAATNAFLVSQFRVTERPPCTSSCNGVMQGPPSSSSTRSSGRSDARNSSVGGRRGVAKGSSQWSGRRRELCAAVGGSGGSGGGAGGGGDSMDKVRLLIGMATRDDKKRGFGPPPPKDKAAGSGFVNLTGREDLMAGRREFDLAFSSSTPPEALLAQARARAKARTIAQSQARKGEGLSGGEESDGDAEGSWQVDNEIRGADLERNGSTGSVSARAGSGVDGKAAEHTTTGFPLTFTGLPLDLTPSQTVISAGMLAVTALAVGKGSSDILSDEVIWLLRVWMAIAWTTHCSLGAFAAFICHQSGNQLSASSASKWFFKISLAGFIAFSEFWNVWRPRGGL